MRRRLHKCDKWGNPVVLKFDTTLEQKSTNDIVAVTKALISVQHTLHLKGQEMNFITFSLSSELLVLREF